MRGIQVCPRFIVGMPRQPSLPSILIQHLHLNHCGEYISFSASPMAQSEALRTLEQDVAGWIHGSANILSQD